MVDFLELAAKESAFWFCVFECVEECAKAVEVAIEAIRALGALVSTLYASTLTCDSV